jgi:hypothetical protein
VVKTFKTLNDEVKKMKKHIADLQNELRENKRDFQARLKEYQPPYEEVRKKIKKRADLHIDQMKNQNKNFIETLNLKHETKIAMWENKFNLILSEKEDENKNYKLEIENLKSNLAKTQNDNKILTTNLSGKNYKNDVLEQQIKNLQLEKQKNYNKEETSKKHLSKSVVKEKQSTKVKIQNQDEKSKFGQTKMTFDDANPNTDRDDSIKNENLATNIKDTTLCTSSEDPKLKNQKENLNENFNLLETCIHIFNKEIQNHPNKYMKTKSNFEKHQVKSNKMEDKLDKELRTPQIKDKNEEVGVLYLCQIWSQGLDNRYEEMKSTLKSKTTHIKEVNMLLNDTVFDNQNYANLINEQVLNVLKVTEKSCWSGSEMKKEIYSKMCKQIKEDIQQSGFDPRKTQHLNEDDGILNQHIELISTAHACKKMSKYFKHKIKEMKELSTETIKKYGDNDKNDALDKGHKTLDFVNQKNQSKHGFELTEPKSCAFGEGNNKLKKVNLTTEKQKKNDDIKFIIKIMKDFEIEFQLSETKLFKKQKNRSAVAEWLNKSDFKNKETSTFVNQEILKHMKDKGKAIFQFIGLSSVKEIYFKMEKEIEDQINNSGFDPTKIPKLTEGQIEFLRTVAQAQASRKMLNYMKQKIQELSTKTD